MSTEAESKTGYENLTFRRSGIPGWVEIDLETYDGDGGTIQKAGTYRVRDLVIAIQGLAT